MSDLVQTCAQSDHDLHYLFSNEDRFDAEPCLILRTALIVFDGPL